MCPTARRSRARCAISSLRRENAIAPGLIVTEQTENARAGTVHYSRVLGRTPMQRWGEPHLVRPALFLASDQTQFVTGILLPVDGELSANL